MCRICSLSAASSSVTKRSVSGAPSVVLDILVQERRDQAAAERFLRQVLHGCEYEPRVVITDKLASYGPAIKRVLPHTEHRRHKASEQSSGELASTDS